MSTPFHHHHAGLVFYVFTSSRHGLLNVSLSCGGCDFLGYVRTPEEAITLIETKY